MDLNKFQKHAGAVAPVQGADPLPLNPMATSARQYVVQWILTAEVQPMVSSVKAVE